MSAKRKPKPIEWTKQDIRLSDHVEVAAKVSGGLAVHHRFQTSLGWSVTHVRSGVAVAPFFFTEAGARSFAEEILPLTDWTRSQKQIVRLSAEKKAKLVAARDRWRDV